MKVKSCPSICSDMSLAGSLMSFDSYRLGASKHQSDVADDGVAEKKETLDVEYIANALRSELTTQSHDAITQKAKKTISFHGPPDVAVVNNDASEEESEADYESQRFDGQDSDEEVKKNRVNSESVLEEHSGDSNLVSETNDIWADQVDIENNMQAESNSEGQSTDTNENVIEKNVIDNTILENCSIGLSKSLPSLVINKIISVSKVEDETNEVELENQIELSETESIPEELVNDVVDDGVFNDEVVDEAYNDEISDEM